MDPGLRRGDERGYMEKKKQIILTGERPTGPLHIGHYAGALQNRVALQNSGKYDEIFVIVADAQGLTDNADNPDKIRNNVLEVALDNMAVGIDPKISTLFLQSQVHELPELSFYYSNLVSVARLERNPTIKSEIAEKSKFNEGVPVGFFTYPISQAADITAFDATLVPVGQDQKPVVEQTNEIVRKFNSLYGETLVEPECLIVSDKNAARLVGTDGNAKMSKSLGNTIYLKDSSDEIAAKIKNMFTDPLHLRVEDPGHTENNPVFIYLDVFSRPEHFAAFLPEYENMAALKAHYQRGGLGDGVVKKFLNSVLQETLRPIRERRESLAKDPAAVMEILRKGTLKARERAAATRDRVMKAMKLDYFN
ncbi:MAG: tryptophan--tRNA ligase [Rickettsiales bacterium]|jgi:tryptophanyl-tRNA synthetase|nr:tryptophan--tRNA ligase [Rickettsiales bacterium]